MFILPEDLQDFMNSRPFTLAFLLMSFLFSDGRADEESITARWDFGAEESTLLLTHGGVQRDQAGPRAPEFPNFSGNNTAIRLDGKGAYVAVSDPGSDSVFDFSSGDAITLEAWVRLDENAGSSPMYVIGKGRTGAPTFARDNQNWALRVVETKGIVKLSFLFATARGQGDSHWHRWTSEAGFDAASLWHHIAVAYRFGQPDSIRGWIDGRPTSGSWGLGGATKKPPVVDDDAVWIGSSQGGNAGNSFRGWIDAVMIHRDLISDELMAARFRRVGGPRVVRPLPEVMPEIADVPKGRVVVTLAERLPDRQRWLNEDETWPREAARWAGEEFLLPRIPLRYDDWGIRASWKAPLLLRMAADVELPPGTHRFLLRCRGLGRLWVDGEVVARTPAIAKEPPNGEEPMTPVAEPPMPGMRTAGYHQQEVFGETTIPATTGGQPRRCRVVLELAVGGKNRRAETGEICVAVRSQDGERYLVLQPSMGTPDGHAAPLTLADAAIQPALARIESFLSGYDDQTRRRAAASQDDFWRRRHELARQWAEQNPAPPIPPARDSTTAAISGDHPIDAFLADKIDRALAESSKFNEQTTRHFHEHVLLILREQCFRCHGEKEKGGLRLNSRERALKSGDSEVPAVVPGDLEASELVARIRSGDMPPTGDSLSQQQIAVLEKWIEQGAYWPAPPISDAEVAMSPVIGDEAFLRRIYLDTIGVSPTEAEAAAFFADADPDKRQRLINQLLGDDRCADHWMSFWLDALAENPTLLNQSLNSTGPFRWFLYDSLRDNKPLDRMVTELILMRGSQHEGGSAGFAMAAENDAPLAAKAHIVASAFLGVELQCARCHDSPYHSTTQRDLFALAAMLERKSVTVPETSRVPAAFFEKQDRESLIRATLKHDEQVAAAWPLADVTGVVDNDDIDPLMNKPDDTRERLAALITAPQNSRFAKVMVNGIWKRLIGAGFVEPAHDWEGRSASHPELLDWLSHQLLVHNYDPRHVIRLIVTSRVYQSEAIGNNLDALHQQRFFNACDRRRLTAEQIVDSLHVVAGSTMDAGELTFVHDGRRDISNRLTLGRPTRAWMFASLNNERDRPSLSLPKARAVTDVLEAFGWNGSRQKPVHGRDTDPDVLQPGALANGTLTMKLSRASHGSELANLAVEADSPDLLVDALFLRVLSRRPRFQERMTFVSALAQGFRTRHVASDATQAPESNSPLPLVTWFNHLQPDANTIQQENERRVREGPPADPRLRSEWRELYEDVVWSLINHREFVWIP
jgi:cytochrome c553